VLGSLVGFGAVYGLLLLLWLFILNDKIQKGPGPAPAAHGDHGVLEAAVARAGHADRLTG